MVSINASRENNACLIGVWLRNSNCKMQFMQLTFFLQINVFTVPVIRNFSYVKIINLTICLSTSRLLNQYSPSHRHCTLLCRVYIEYDVYCLLDGQNVAIFWQIITILQTNS